MSHVRKLWIEGPAGRLEALLRVACPARAAAVVAHPHPLHGGTMHNPVVFHSDRELHRAGFTTLRFNFRGVGSSTGTHDEGQGEVGDVAAAFAWLSGVAVGLPLFVVGYSFGSWCGIRFAGEEPRVHAFVAIGLPVHLFSFDVVRAFARPLVVVQGSEDEYGRPEEVSAALAGTDPPAVVSVVDGASHLFGDRAGEAAAAVVEGAVSLL